MSKLSRDTLENLAVLLATVMEDRLNETTPITEMTLEGPVVVGYKRAATSGDLTAIAKFLKDNNVMVPVERASKLRALEAQMANKPKRSDGVVALPLPNVAAAGNEY